MNIEKMNRKSLSSRSIFIVQFLPGVVYLSFIFFYGVNIPFSDDYAHLRDTISFLQENDLAKMFYTIMGQHNEHRPVFSRLMFISTYYFLGEIDFKILVLIGNGALFGLCYFFYKTFPSRPGNPILFFPVSLFLFQIQGNWVQMFWAMGALSNLYVFCFTGFALLFLHRRSKISFILAILFSLIAVFTQGSGIITPFACLFLLLIQKRMEEMRVWLGGLLGVVLVYFYFLPFNFSNNSLLETFQFRHVILIIEFFFSFLGSIGSFHDERVMFGLGVFLFSLFVFFTFKKYYRKNPPVYFFMVHLIFAGLLVSLFRFNLGIQSVLADRYKIGSLLLVTSLYVCSIDYFSAVINRKKICVFLIISLSSLYYFHSVALGISKLNKGREVLIHRLNAWVHENAGLYSSNQREANSTLVRALEMKIYDLPYQYIPMPDNRFSPVTSFEGSCSENSLKELDAELNVLKVGPEQGPFLVRLEGVIYESPGWKITSEKSPGVLILDSRKDRYQLLARHPKDSKNSIHYKPDKVNIGFLALIPFQKLKDGNFRIGLCYKGPTMFTDIYMVKEKNRLITPQQSLLNRKG